MNVIGVIRLAVCGNTEFVSARKQGRLSSVSDMLLFNPGDVDFAAYRVIPEPWFAGF